MDLVLCILQCSLLIPFFQLLVLNSSDTSLSIFLSKFIAWPNDPLYGNWSFCFWPFVCSAKNVSKLGKVTVQKHSLLLFHCTAIVCFLLISHPYQSLTPKYRQFRIPWIFGVFLLLILRKGVLREVFSHLAREMNFYDVICSVSLQVK